MQGRGQRSLPGRLLLRGRPAWLRYLVGVAVTLVVAALLAVPWAALTSQATGVFGPHNARYTMTTNHLFTVDLGPLGTIELPARQLPAPLGVNIEVKEIPSGLSPVGKPNTLDDLARDVDSYALFFNSPDTQISMIAGGLVRSFAWRVLLAAVVLTAGFFAVRWLLGRGRRSELTGRIRSHPRIAGGVAGAVVLALVVGVAVAWPRHDAAPEGDPLFDGTPLAGARVTGRLSSVVDQVGGLVVDYYKSNESFYSEALKNLNAQLAAEAALAGPDPAASAVPGGGTAGAPGSGPTTATGAATGAVAPTSSVAATPSPDDVATFLVVSDVHCNVGMSRIVGRVARARAVDAVVDAGDVTMTGTSAETYCVHSLTDALPKDAKKVFVKGNHDSPATVQEEKSVGATVLEGKPVEVDGITFLGDSDPRRTVFGEGTHFERKETMAQLSDRMADVACAADQRVDVLLIHDPVAGAGTLDRGCAPLQISGHWHRRVGPEPSGRGIRYVNSTTGGAIANALTPGPLRMDAEMTLFRFDKGSGRAIDYQLVTVHPDRSVTIGAWVPVPVPVPSADPGTSPPDTTVTVPDEGSPEGGPPTGTDAPPTGD